MKLLGISLMHSSSMINHMKIMELKLCTGLLDLILSRGQLTLGDSLICDRLAPVSDREYKSTLPETASMIDLAVKMISDGRGSELMPREADPCAPITAYKGSWNRYWLTESLLHDGDTTE
ncbi:hypothetical protein LIER_28851 [Lithospermum erythrorhizon]|uniref:Uncharacterized protein n=1 Tax=Lithospermum erythrorhizon TaxID=34254 RepID=A0AAV3RIQ5_LITER